MYPFMIDIKDKKIVIIGGGKVAANRVISLLPWQPQITIISSTLDERLQKLVEENNIHYEARNFHLGDVEEAFIVIAATNDRHVNQLVKNSCHKNQLFNIVDDPAESSFHFPALHVHNGITVAVTTSGISPLLAKHLRDEFASIIDEFDEGYLSFLQEIRKLVKEKQLAPLEKRTILQQCLLEKYIASSEERKTYLQQVQLL